MASRGDVVAFVLLVGCGPCGESELHAPWTFETYRGHEVCGPTGTSGVVYDDGTVSFLFSPHWGGFLRSNELIDATAPVQFVANVPHEALAEPGPLPTDAVSAFVIADEQICASLGCDAFTTGIVQLGPGTGTLENLEAESTAPGVAGSTGFRWRIGWDLAFGDADDLNAMSAHLVGEDDVVY